MAVYLLLFLYLSTSAFSIALEKNIQLGMKNNFPSIVMFNLVTSAFGSLYFLFFCKFNIQMNLTTFAFSLGYAMFVVASLLIVLISLAKMTIPVKTIVTMLGNVFGATLIGKVCFNDAITINSLISIIFLIAAVFVQNPKSNKTQEKKNSFIVSFWLFFISAIGSVYIKFYTESPHNLGANNLFFMSNFICLIICLIASLIYSISKGTTGIKSIFTSLGMKQLSNIGLRTLIANIGSIASTAVIAVMDISVYTVLTSSATLIISALISKFIFFENLNWTNYLSVLLAIASIVIRVI